jgi:hypothetical protein
VQSIVFWYAEAGKILFCKPIKFMKEPYFKPWIGEDYETSNPRIMVLGESHYGVGDEPETFTQGVIKEWALGGKGNRFFTTTAKILSGKPYEWMSADEKRTFWQTVVFYNFIQKIVGTGPRIRPDEQMWQDSKEALNHVLAQISPEIIVVLGKALRWHTEPFLSSYNEIIVCYWTHPSAPHFKKQVAIDAFNQAKMLHDNR